MKCHEQVEIDENTLSISILQICKDIAELKIAESIEIRNHKPVLNIMTSSWTRIKPVPYSEIWPLTLIDTHRHPHPAPPPPNDPVTSSRSVFRIAEEILHISSRSPRQLVHGCLSLLGRDVYMIMECRMYIGSHLWEVVCIFIMMSLFLSCVYMNTCT